MRNWIRHFEQQMCEFKHQMVNHLFIVPILSQGHTHSRSSPTKERGLISWSFGKCLWVFPCNVQREASTAGVNEALVTKRVSVLFVNFMKSHHLCSEAYWVIVQRRFASHVIYHSHWHSHPNRAAVWTQSVRFLFLFQESFPVSWFKTINFAAKKFKAHQVSIQKTFPSPN